MRFGERTSSIAALNSGTGSSSRSRKPSVSSLTALGTGAPQVEVIVVDPDRVVNLERHRRETLTVARRAPEPAADVLPQLAEVGTRPVLRRREERDPADVHVRGRGLDTKKRRIKRRQAGSGHFVIPP